MSVYREFVCCTCKEIYPCPRGQEAGDAFVEQKQKEHDGHKTDQYNDVAPSYEKDGDLWMDGWVRPDYIWIKGYSSFSVVK